MDDGLGSPASYAECYQWFIAPTDLGDNHPDPAKAPDVINNSWGCTPTEGCTHPEILRHVVQCDRARGHDSSSVPGGGYDGGWSGTSMAAPHVAGLVALLLSAQPALNGRVDTLETLIENTATALTIAAGYWRRRSGRGQNFTEQP